MEQTPEQNERIWKIGFTGLVIISIIGLIGIHIQGQLQSKQSYLQGLNAQDAKLTQLQTAYFDYISNHSVCEAYVNGTTLYVLNCTKSRINLPDTFYAMNLTDINTTIGNYYDTTANWVLMSAQWNCSGINITENLGEPHLAEARSSWLTQNGIEGVSKLEIKQTPCKFISVENYS